MADRWAYAVFDILIASSLLGARIWRLPIFTRWRDFVRALLLVSLPFIVWDVFAAHAGHWYFSQRYTLGFRLFGLPVEELLFFVAVPMACMVVWHALQGVRPFRLFGFRQMRLGGIIAGLLFLAASVLAVHRPYTALALLAVVGSSWVLAYAVWLSRGLRFWVFQLVSFWLFFICNTYLTALPIISYDPQAITGWRLGTIPLEDCLYNFSLLSLFLVAYTWRERTEKRQHTV